MIGINTIFYEICRIFLLIFVDFFKKRIIIVFRMDIIQEKPMTLHEVTQSICEKRVVAGAKQLRKALTSGTAECVYLAVDADPAITEPVMELCRQYHVQMLWVRSMAELGRACRIDVGAAAAAVLKSL